MSETVSVRLMVNGVDQELVVEPRLLLVHALRDHLGLTGTHVGCDTSNCGACTIHLDGRAVKSCTVLAVQADGADVTTIEGLARDGHLHPMQEAFWNDHALQVRNRGTIGGSLAHGDPASDLPAVFLAIDGSVTLQGPRGTRTIGAADLFRGYLETAIEPGEVLTEVRFPALEGYGFGYEKFNRRSEDWAMVAVSALIKRSGDVCEDVRAGLTNMGVVPLRARAVEEALRGQPLSTESVARAAQRAADATEPPADLNASADYKRHLAMVLCRRALEEAAGLA